MRWKVTGAEASSGAEQTVNVEAPTVEEAEAKARSFGLLVSAVHPDTDTNLYETKLDYAAKGSPTRSSRTAQRLEAVNNLNAVAGSNAQLLMIVGLGLLWVGFAGFLIVGFVEMLNVEAIRSVDGGIKIIISVLILILIKMFYPSRVMPDLRDPSEQDERNAK